MNTQDTIREKQKERRVLQGLYAHAVQRARDLRTRVVPEDKEALRRKYLRRVEIEKTNLVQEINDLGEEIWKLQREAENNG